MNIWENLKADHLQSIIAEDNKNSPNFTQFKELSIHYIIKLLNQSPSKSCELHPIPTTILKEVLPSIVPLFTSIVTCLSTRSKGSPSQTTFKEGQLRTHW